MVVRLGGRAGGMSRWSDMYMLYMLYMCMSMYMLYMCMYMDMSMYMSCAQLIHSIDTVVLVPEKFRRRENPARRRGRTIERR